jgi:integrase
MVENYVVRHASTKRSGAEIARRLRKNVSEVIGTIKLADLHRRDLTRCIDAIKDRGAATEANRVFEDMRAMIRWARGRGDLDQNLVEGMRRPAESVERDRVLSAEEIRIMWSGMIDAKMWESTRRILRLCLVTGQRVGEIAGMVRDELDLGRRIWTIPASRSKNGREHGVPLSALALAIIQEQCGDVEALAARKGRAVPPFIFPGPGGRAAVTAASLPKAVKRLENDGKVFGVDPFTPHDLRRTAATHMEEIGISPFVVGHVLNHISITKSSITSRVYARYDYRRKNAKRWTYGRTGWRRSLRAGGGCVDSGDRAMKKSKKIVGTGMMAREVEYVDDLFKVQKFNNLNDAKAYADKLKSFFDDKARHNDIYCFIEDVGLGAAKLLHDAGLPHDPALAYEFRRDTCNWRILSKCEPWDQQPANSIWTQRGVRSIVEEWAKATSRAEDCSEVCAARGLDLADRILSHLAAGEFEWACRLSFDLGGLYTTCQIREDTEPTWVRGDKVLRGAQTGHEQVYGTMNQKQQHWRKIADDLRTELGKGTKKTAAYGLVAERHNVSVKTVQRAWNYVGNS